MIASSTLGCDGHVVIAELRGGVITAIADSTPCPITIEASAPILGEDAAALEQAHRAARRNVLVLADRSGWSTSPSGAPERDLCPRCRPSRAA